MEFLAVSCLTLVSEVAASQLNWLLLFLIDAVLGERGVTASSFLQLVKTRLNVNKPIIGNKFIDNNLDFISNG